MYPKTFLETYWRGDLKPKVFVAMSFLPAFDSLWNNSIYPAVLEATGGALEAYRVDITTIGGNIVTEIIDGIANSTLVWADISIMPEGEWRGQRNGNVMYELGIAMAIRTETDLIVTADTAQGINFDIRNIRINESGGKTADQLRAMFVQLVRNGLAARASAKLFHEKFTWSLLDDGCFNFIARRTDSNGKRDTPFFLPPSDPEFQTLRRLLQYGLVRCEMVHGQRNPTLYQTWYKFTQFGDAVCNNGTHASDEDKMKYSEIWQDEVRRRLAGRPFHQ